MAGWQGLVMMLLLSTVTVIPACKKKQNVLPATPKGSALTPLDPTNTVTYDYVENEHFFDQFPEIGSHASIDLPEMLVLPMEIYLAPSWRSEFGDLEGRRLSKEILGIVRQMFLDSSLRTKFFLVYDDSSIMLSDKEIDLTRSGLKALGNYISEPIKRAAIAYLKVIEGPVLGIANLGFICDHKKKKARYIVRWRNSAQETALVIAHELGHILGIYHDFERYIHTDEKQRQKVRISKRTHTCGPGEYNGGPNNKIMNYGQPMSSSWSECNNRDLLAFCKLVTVNDGSFCLEEERIDCKDANNNVERGCIIGHGNCPHGVGGCMALDVHFVCSDRSSTSSYTYAYILTCSTVGPIGRQCMTHVTDQEKWCQLCCRYDCEMMEGCAAALRRRRLEV